MNVKQLSGFEGELQRGNILRCSGSYPYEEFVDFMLFETIWEEQHRYGLMTISGYKAGLIFAVLPAEVWQMNGLPGLSSEWLRAHWEEWGYGECPLEEVQVLEPDIPAGFASGA